MNIIVQTTDGDAYSLHGKIESLNKTFANITRDIILNSIYKKELWCFVYKYAVWLSCRTDNKLFCDVPYLLRHGTRPSYKHIKIQGVRIYIINGRETRNKLDHRSH